MRPSPSSCQALKYFRLIDCYLRLGTPSQETDFLILSGTLRKAVLFYCLATSILPSYSRPPASSQVISLSNCRNRISLVRIYLIWTFALLPHAYPLRLPD